MTATIVFTAWFLISAAAQYPDDSYTRIRRLGGSLANNFLIPNWKFFAPNPGIEDVVLLYRIRDSSSGIWSAWRRVLPEYRPSLLRSFISRESRLNKGVLDIYSTLQGLHDGLYEKEYIACRNLLHSFVKARIERPSGADMFQLMIAHSAGYEDKLLPRYDAVFKPRQFEEVM
ncbi:hypothetical protein [Actinomyces sp. 2119]|uniref:hypothetical protein n=1 Tax=Actinomyces sp. 2119 TaxID=2321393 RepID=UPI0011C347EB|nr:hypothetical protein [Actinomyces sp. 2119]